MQVTVTSNLSTHCNMCRMNQLLLSMSLLLPLLLPPLSLLACEALPAQYSHCSQWQINTTANFIQCPQMVCCTQADIDACKADNGPTYTCKNFGPDLVGVNGPNDYGTNAIGCDMITCPNGECAGWVGGIWGQPLVLCFLLFVQGYLVPRHVMP